MNGPVAEPAEFRRLMARWATGVSVVTARDGARDFGMTVNALLSVSLEPPLLLVSLSSAADTTPAVERSGAFAVSLLAADQRELSERFARAVPPEEKFAGLGIARGRSGAPLLPDALGWLECRVRSVTEAADHRLVLGDVQVVSLGRDSTPLIFHRSGYARASGADAITLPARR